MYDLSHVQSPFLGAASAEIIWTVEPRMDTIQYTNNSVEEAKRMSKSQKLFRYLWRINAVPLLFAAGAIPFGVGVLLVGEFGARTAHNREAETGIPVAAADS